jgi:hypothetical protein
MLQRFKGYWGTIMVLSNLAKTVLATFFLLAILGSIFGSSLVSLVLAHGPLTTDIETPTGLSVSNTTLSSITWIWDKYNCFGDTGGPDCTYVFDHYDIMRDGGLSSDVEVTTESYTWSSLGSNEAHGIQVRICDLTSCGDWSFESLASTDSLPDLFPADGDAPTTMCANNSYTFTGTVENSNLAENVNGFHSIELTFGSWSCQTSDEILDDVPNAGSTASASCNIIPTTAGSYTLQVEVDVNDQIAELDEGNNGPTSYGSFDVDDTPGTPNPSVDTQTQTSIVWDWPSVSGATGYDYRWRESGGSWSSWIDNGSSTQAQETSLNCGTNHDIEVRANNSCGDGSVGSSTGDSTDTCSVVTVSNVQARPDSYTGTGEWDDDTTIYLTWDQTNADECRAELNDSTPDEDAGTDGQDTDTGSEGLNTYYVECSNATSSASGSDTISIDTIDPTCSNADTHCDNYTDSCTDDDDTTIYFTWDHSDSGSGVTTCWAEIGGNPPDEDSGTDGEDTDIGTEGSNTYRVECEDLVGNRSSTCSDTIDITINECPATPSIVSPSNNSTGINVNADLSWSGTDPDGDALDYDVNFCTGSSCSPTYQTTVSNTTWDPGTLSELTTYRWEIAADDGTCSPVFSNTWSFTTEDSTAPTGCSFSGDGGTCDEITWSITGCSDSGSGMHTSPYSFDNGSSWQSANTFEENVTGGGSVTRTAKVRDNDLNQWTSSSQVVSTSGCDTSAPSITFTPTSRSWDDTNVDVTVDVTDSSGVVRTEYCWTTGSSCTPATTFTNGGTITQTSNGSWTLCIEAEDGDGNFNNPAVCAGSYQVDKADPTASFSGDGSTCEEITWTITDADDTGGSGLHSSAYSFNDGSSWQLSDTWKQTISGGGDSTITARVRDNADNHWISSAVTESTAACTTPSFTVSASPTSRTITQGDTTDYTITVTAIAGFTDSVSISQSGCPGGGTSCLLTPPACDPNGGTCTSTLDITNTSGSTTGSHTLVITGTATGFSDDTVNVDLTINSSGSVPTPPTGMTHNDNSTDSVQWDWNTVTGADDYDLYVDGNYQSTVTVPGSGVWDDGGLSTNTEHSGEAFACNIDGCSASSGTHNAYTSAAVPGNPEFGTVTENSIEVRSLNPPTSWPDQTAMEIENEISGADSGWQVSNAYWQDTSVACGTSYDYRIRARNGDGDTTAWSSTNSQSTNDCTSPDFFLTRTPTSSTISQGQTASFTVTVNSTANFNSSVSFSQTGCPGGGATCTYSPTSCTPPTNSTCTTTLTVDNTGSANTGLHTITTTGVSGALSRITSVDLTINATAGNNPPNIPNNPSPFSGQLNVPVTTNLSWSGGDIDSDPVVYDVYFCAGSSCSLTYQDTVSATSYNPPSDLADATQHSWQIIADDQQGESNSVVTGPIWSFTTVSPVGDPPQANFSFCRVVDNTVQFTDLSNDPDGTVDFWDWDFGDGSANSGLQHPQHNFDTGVTSLNNQTRLAGNWLKKTWLQVLDSIQYFEQKVAQLFNDIPKAHAQAGYDSGTLEFEANIPSSEPTAICQLHTTGTQCTSIGLDTTNNISSWSNYSGRYCTDGPNDGVSCSSGGDCPSGSCDNDLIPGFLNGSFSGWGILVVNTVGTPSGQGDWIEIELPSDFPGLGDYYLTLSMETEVADLNEILEVSVNGGQNQQSNDNDQASQTCSFPIPFNLSPGDAIRIEALDDSVGLDWWQLRGDLPVGDDDCTNPGTVIGPSGPPWDVTLTVTDNDANIDAVTYSVDPVIALDCAVNQAPLPPTNLEQQFYSLPGGEGTLSDDDTPSFEFGISDPDNGDIVGYQIQIATDSSFSSSVIDFTWTGSTTNPNTVTFQVPDTCPGSGYTICTAPLPEGDYYWRVRSQDAAALQSAWADDDFGFAGTGIDFTVDLTADNFTIWLSPAATSVPQGTAAIYQVTISPTGDFSDIVDSWLINNCPGAAGNCSLDFVSCAEANYADCGDLTVDTSTLPPATYNTLNTSGVGGSPPLLRNSNEVSLTVTSVGGNNPPNLPTNPVPSDTATDIAVGTSLSFVGGDPDGVSDTVTYTLSLWEEGAAFGTMPFVKAVTGDINNINFTTTDIGGPLASDLDYTWQVTADDGTDSVIGSIWSFTTTFVPIGNPPVADFEFCQVSGNTVKFFDLSTDSDGTVDFWSWDFGDSSGVSSLQYPEYTYASAADYSVILTATDNDGNPDSVILTVNPSSATGCGFILTNVVAPSCSVVSLAWDVGFAADDYEIYRNSSLAATIDAQDTVFCGAFGCAWDDNTVSQDTFYDYYVRAIRPDSSGWNNSTAVPVCTGSDTNTCPLSDTTPSCQVNGISATSPACGVIQLDWDPATGAIEYNIYRSLAVGTYSLLATVPGGTTTYSDFDIISSVAYFYYVTTVLDDGQGGTFETAPSDIASTSSNCFRSPTFIER